ncbi:unnamed protein product, partial [Rhizoctonia solani]
ADSSVAPKIKVDEAVAKADKFISENYQAGDDIILIANNFCENDRAIDAASILARHLHDGTHPHDLSKKRPNSGGDVPSGRIPIYCVVVSFWDSPKDISVLNNELRSWFPPGIEHLVSYVQYENGASACSTTLDWDSSIISREIYFFPHKSDWRVLIYATKHVVHYNPDHIPKWDQHNSVWSHISNTPLGGPSESVRPVGMYRHELRKYEEDYPILVWKATRHPTST